MVRSSGMSLYRTVESTHGKPGRVKNPLALDLVLGLGKVRCTHHNPNLIVIQIAAN